MRILATALWLGTVANGQSVIYVDVDASGLMHDGSSWCNAFIHLQDALAAAAKLGDNATEIHVADGTYKPDRGIDITAGDQYARFRLLPGIALYGGYAGCGAEDPDERDIGAYETLLSGDLSGDDREGESNCCVANGGPGCDDPICVDLVSQEYWMNSCRREWTKSCARFAELHCCNVCNQRCENSRNVVTARGTGEDTLLDGFTVTGGFAGTQSSSRGAGLSVVESSGAKFSRCSFTNNYARQGGGVYIDYFSGGQVFTQCTFEGNTAMQEGGAISISGHDGTRLTDCTFQANEARYGGGIYLKLNYSIGSAGIWDHCAFVGNQAAVGGAVFSEDFDGSDPGVTRINNCVFLSNSAYGGSGGAILLGDSGQVHATQCTFSGNEANSYGGAVAVSRIGGSHSWFRNCTISGNTARWSAGGVFSWGNGVPLTSSILWGNRDADGTGESSQVTILTWQPYNYIDYCAIQGWTGQLRGIGNVGEDPLFIDPDGPDGMFGTVDDDLHLSDKSPCIDAGDPQASDLPDLDPDRDPRIIGCRVDMGVDEVPTSADCNENGLHDGCDVVEGRSEDCTDNGMPDECEPDCNGNQAADSCDLADGSSSDCNANDTPDECDLAAGISADCNENTTPDECEIAAGEREDCNGNSTLDECEIAGLTTFSDTFSEETLNPSRWPIVEGARVSATYFVSAPQSVEIIANGRITSAVLDLSGASTARLSYYWRSRQTRSEQDLTVTYWDGQTWVVLAVHPGGVDTPAWEQAAFELSQQGPHADFRLRFEGTSTHGRYMWYVDDVSVTVSSPDCNESTRLDVCERIGGFDVDQDRDLRDFSRLQACYTGQAMTVVPHCCVFFDFDADADVDLDDAAAFHMAITGP